MKALCLLIVCLSTVTVFGQNPSWVWATNTQSTSTNSGNAVTTDSVGNVYVTGYYYAPSINFGTQVLENLGQSDFFLVKYDPQGNVIWAKSAGSPDFDEGNAVATDRDGNVYVTGSFNGDTIAFDNIILTNSNPGVYHFFLVKYNSDGNALWAINPDNDNWSYGHDLVVDEGGNIIVTGGFAYPTLQFGSDTLYNNGSTGNDVFIMKFHPEVGLLWAVNAGGDSYDVGYGIDYDENKDIYVTGSFSSTMVWGSDTLTSAGGSDICVLKCNEFGNPIWAKSAGGVNHEDGLSLDVSSDQSVFVTGLFASPFIDFSSNPLVNLGDNDIFLAKLDQQGNTIWSKRAGESGWDEAFGVTSDLNSNAYLTGSFRSASITFGNETLTNANAGKSDLFVTGYDGALGNVIWAKHAGQNEHDGGSDICVDPTGALYVTGGFGSSFIEFGSTTLLNASNSDVFLAKIDLSTDIEKLDHHSEIRVYPNPSSGSFWVKIPQSTEDILIYNATGQLIQALKPQGISNHQLELKENGLYWLSVESDRQTYFKKLVVIK